MDTQFTESHVYPSYSQAGEDRIVHYIFECCGNAHNLRYADIGASVPAGHNNTYLFYTLGGSGLLVEADQMYFSAYQTIRPRDASENVAIVPSRMRSGGRVSFMKMNDRGWSTVSETHAALAMQVGKNGAMDPVRIDVPCLTINEILDRHFAPGELDLISIDIEGVDREVLSELNLELHRPKVVIVEVGEFNPFTHTQQTLLPGYSVFASTYVNLVLIEDQFFKTFSP